MNFPITSIITMFIILTCSTNIYATNKSQQDDVMVIRATLDKNNKVVYLTKNEKSTSDTFEVRVTFDKNGNQVVLTDINKNKSKKK